MVILLYSAALALALSTHLLSRCLSPPSIYTFSPSSPRFCTSSFAAMTACSPHPLYLLSVFSVLQTNASIYSTLRSYFCVCSATTERERGLTVAVDTYLLPVPVTVASARASQEVFHGRSLSAEHHFIIIGLALFLELLRPAQASMYAHRGTRSSLPWVAGLSARPRPVCDFGHPCRVSLVRSVGQSVVSQWHSSAQRLQPPVQPGDSQGHCQWHTTAESATLYTASDDLAPRVSGSLVLSGVWAYGRLHNVVVRTLARD